MPSDDSGGWLTDAVSDGVETIRKVTSFLGVEREAFVCPECTVACEETHVYNPETAAFDGGACPAWVCPDCGREYVRETDDDAHTMDLYGRGPPE